MDAVNNIAQKLPASCESDNWQELCLLYKTVLTTTGQKHEFYSAV